MILAADRCRERSPNIYVADSISEIEGILNPRLGDVVLVIAEDGFNVYRLTESSQVPDGIEVILSNSCEYVWVLASSGSGIDIGIFGVTTSSSDNADAINAAIEAVSDAGGGELVFGRGIYYHSGIVAREGVSLRGQGSGRINQGGATILYYTGSGVSIGQNGSSEVFSFSLKHIGIRGTEGNGGTGILLDSFWYAWIEDVLIDRFRNVGDTGYGLRMINTHGLCVFNRFIGLTVENCDTAIEMDSVNAANSTGYSYFAGTVIHQEQTCLSLKRTAANGSIYNVFDGIFIQGSTGATGDYLYIEGVGNCITGVIIDQAQTGDVLKFALFDTTDNYVRFIGGFDVAKYTNNQTFGASNIVDFDGYVTHSPGKPFTIHDRLSQTEFALRSNSGDPVEVHFGNDDSQAWRQIMSGNQANFSFLKLGTGTIFRLGAALVESLANLSVTGNINTTGNVILPNSQSILWASSTAVEEAGISLSASNNLQVLAPTEGGNVQLITRNAANNINLLPGSLNGISVDATTTAGLTRLLVYDVDGAALYRVKVGANGTGPGGVGRALYIDNV